MRFFIGLALSLGLLIYLKPTPPKFENLYVGAHTQYNVKTLKTIETPDKQTLSIEKAYKQVGNGIYHTVPYERIQIRNQEGLVVAHTPTRVKAILLCGSIEKCYVYMWKTVYPFPALFKLNPDQKTWIAEKHPIMRYSRKQYAGEGFTEETSLINGIMGMPAFIFIHLWYYVLFTVFTFLLLQQLLRVPSIPENKKTYSMLLTTAISIISPLFMAFTSRFILAIVTLLFFGSLATGHFGIPSTHSLSIWMTTLIFAARNLGEKSAEIPWNARKEQQSNKL